MEVIKEISLDDIIEPKESVRTVIILEGLEDLAQSIRMVGLIQPIHVKEVGKKFEVVAGHRRFLACRMAGKHTAKAIILEGSTVNSDQLKLHENYFREDVNPLDEGRWFTKLKADMGWTQAELAKFVNRSDTYVATRMQLLTGSPEVIAALEGGQISVSQARELNLVESDSIRQELLRITIEGGATVSTLRIMRQDYEGRFTPPPEGIPSGDVAGQPSEPVTHKIRCVFCDGDFNINQIYPITACRTCRNGVLSGLAEGKTSGHDKQ